MLQILLIEIKRYRLWAAGIALIHFFYWVVINTFGTNQLYVPKLIPVSDTFKVTMIFALILGFLFGFVQIGRYKPLNRWTYLVQRPLAVSKIYLGLAGAAISFLFAVVFLPWFLMVAIFDIFTETVVDTRHYLHGIYMLAMAIGAYLGGSFAKLSPFKSAFLVTILVMFVVGHPPHLLDHKTLGFGTFALVTAVILSWLFYLNLRAFKPDLQAPERGMAATILTALPLQIAILYGLGFLVFAGYETSHHLLANPNEDPSGEPMETAFFKMAPKERVRYLLDKENIANKDSLIHQLKLADVGYSGAVPANYPKRHQLYVYDQPGIFRDHETGSIWMFSHKEMLFKGYDGLSGEPLGWLGASGFKQRSEDFETGRFHNVPLRAIRGCLQLKDVIYMVDFKNRLIHEKHRLPEGEFYYGKLMALDQSVSIASNKHLFLFDWESFWHESDAAEAEYTVPHPCDVANVSHMRTFRLVDGYLVLYANDYLFGGGRPGAILMRIRLNGAHETLLRREFDQFERPAFIRYGRYAMSPLLSALVDEGMWGLIEPEERRHHRFSIFKDKAPRSLWWIWLGMSVACTWVCFLWSARFNLGKLRWYWVISSALLGLPGLLSFWLLNRSES